MTATPRLPQRAAKKSADPFTDPVGALLVRQRPEVAPGSTEPPRPTDAAERITDATAIGQLLGSVSNMADGAEDDLIFELLYLETLIAAKPLKSNELLDQLGALGEEVREGLLPPGMINVVALRRRTRRLKQHLGSMAGRVSAAILMLLTSLPLFGQQASAAEGNDSSLNSFQIAAAPVVRVIDANSGQGLAGVTLKSMEEKVLGVTDANGQATLSEDYVNTDIISLEKNGYELSMMERGQLAARNIISMKPQSDGAHLASQPTSRPHVTAPVPPRDAKPPKLAMSHDGPHVEPPKVPTAPKAPQIRLPVKPRSVAAAKPAAKPVMAALPTKPRPARPLQGDSGDDVPTLTKPRVETPKAPKPAAVAQATKTANHLAKPENADPMAAAARQTAMALPAKPRKPMQVAEAPDLPVMEEGTPEHEPVSIAVPHNVPRASHAAHGGGRGYYQVKPGDSLSKLARRYLGSAKRWPELYALNRGRVSDPALIRVGQVLALPAASTASGRGRTYVVRPGDSLFKIAGSQMGNGSRWQSIYQANRGTIRDARMIFPGQRLYLPV